MGGGTRSERPTFETRAPMLIHARGDGRDCETRKPQVICTCGAYEIAWQPPPASSLAHRWERWWMEGIVPDEEP